MMTNSSITYEDAGVCKDFLAGFCLSELFHGRCSLIHQLDHQRDYQKAGRWSGLNYEKVLYEKLDTIVQEVNVKVLECKKILGQLAPSSPCHEIFDKVDKTESKISRELESLERTGRGGHHHQKHNMNWENIELLKSTQDYNMNLLNSAQYQSNGTFYDLTVCEICGSYMTYPSSMISNASQSLFFKRGQPSSNRGKISPSSILHLSKKEKIHEHQTPQQHATLSIHLAYEKVRKHYDLLHSLYGIKVDKK